MNETTSIPKEKTRKLKYVGVYDTLYAKIESGAYPPGSQLPSEPDLSKQMGISRMTLRQALALLREDGLIRNVQGKGNFVLPRQEAASSGSLTNVTNPILQCGHMVADMELEYRLEPPSEYISHYLGVKTPVIAIIDRWYRDQDGHAFAYSLSFVPSETLSRFRLDLNQTKDLLSFLNQGIYAHTASSSLNFQGTDTGNFTALKYRLSEGDSFLLVQEFLYDEAGTILIATKHYLPLEYCNMNLSFAR